MENEQNYQELKNAYDQLLQQAQQLQAEYQALRADKLGEQWSKLIQMMEHKDNYSPEIIKLVEWHLKQLLEKPKKQTAKK